MTAVVAVRGQVGWRVLQPVSRRYLAGGAHLPREPAPQRAQLGVHLRVQGAPPLGDPFLRGGRAVEVRVEQPLAQALARRLAVRVEPLRIREGRE